MVSQTPDDNLKPVPFAVIYKSLPDATVKPGEKRTEAVRKVQEYMDDIHKWYSERGIATVRGAYVIKASLTPDDVLQLCSDPRVETMEPIYHEVRLVDTTLEEVVAKN